MNASGKPKASSIPYQLAAPCPECHALTGQPCQDISGRVPATLPTVHTDRARLARWTSQDRTRLSGEVTGMFPSADGEE